MSRPTPTTAPTRRGRWLAAWSALLVLGGCARGPGGGAAVPVASDAEWRALASPRPAPLSGAVRLAVAEMDLLGTTAFPSHGRVPAELGLTELVATGLLRRADVRLVERRRFSAAVEAERRGEARPPGAPVAGASPAVELTASAAWVALGVGGASLEVRLAENETGRVVATNRARVPAEAEPVGLARATVRAILDALDELGRLPAWDDPVSAAAPTEYGASGVSSAALAAFLDGLAAEELWRWERARIAYQSALRRGGFVEAEAALARAARLRMGGTLGES